MTNNKLLLQYTPKHHFYQDKTVDNYKEQSM